MTDHIIGKKFIFPTVGYLDIINRYFCDDMNFIQISNIDISTMYIPDELIEFKWNKIGKKLYFKSIP